MPKVSCPLGQRKLQRQRPHRVHPHQIGVGHRSLIVRLSVGQQKQQLSHIAAHIRIQQAQKTVHKMLGGHWLPVRPFCLRPQAHRHRQPIPRHRHPHGRGRHQIAVSHLNEQALHQLRIQRG